MRGWMLSARVYMWEKADRVLLSCHFIVPLSRYLGDVTTTLECPLARHSWYSDTMYAHQRQNRKRDISRMYGRR